MQVNPALAKEAWGPVRFPIRKSSCRRESDVYKRQIKSGTVSIKADRYYVSVLVEIPDAKIANNSNDGIGIDRCV